uniref:Protein kinase domain-containing protein n=1 Tax=Timspurckia oligopyrenoides TaxID=708627 RepID=A0A7S0ZCT6_9RHOD|mmetsp:Transcript_12747/g.22918  ORF Transcript_12747/g.22918 Transcript_12747/m.22918 type:complete len:511 (+) Transcript_12747:3-1535(+)
MEIAKKNDLNDGWGGRNADICEQSIGLRRELARNYSPESLAWAFIQLSKLNSNDIINKQLLVIHEAYILRSHIQSQSNLTSCLCLCIPFVSNNCNAFIVELTPSSSITQILEQLPTNTLPCVCNHSITFQQLYKFSTNSNNTNNILLSSFRTKHSAPVQIGDGHFAKVYSCHRRTLQCSHQLKQSGLSLNESFRCEICLTLLDTNSEKLSDFSFGFETKRFAVKVMEIEDNVHDRIRVAREVRLLRECQSESVTRLIDVVVDENRASLVLEMFHGGDLWKVLQNITAPFLCEADVRKIAKGICHALVVLRKRSVVHRDIKPGNIFCTAAHPASHMFRVKIGDFGMAERLMESRKCQVQKANNDQESRRSEKDSTVKTRAPFPIRTGVRGTPKYTAPEVIRGLKVDCAADMWSFGVVLYLLLTGHFPFDGRNRAVILDSVLDGKVEWERGRWSHVSVQAKNLVKRMLLNMPAYRIVPDQMLEHPWFKLDESALRNRHIVADWRRLRRPVLP